MLSVFGLLSRKLVEDFEVPRHVSWTEHCDIFGGNQSVSAFTFSGSSADRVAHRQSGIDYGDITNSVTVSATFQLSIAVGK